MIPHEQSKLILEDWPEFKKRLEKYLPSLSEDEMHEIWEFGNECWRAGFTFRDRNP